MSHIVRRQRPLLRRRDVPSRRRAPRGSLHARCRRIAFACNIRRLLHGTRHPPRRCRRAGSQPVRLPAPPAGSARRLDAHCASRRPVVAPRRPATGPKRPDHASVDRPAASAAVRGAASSPPSTGSAPAPPWRSRSGTRRGPWTGGVICCTLPASKLHSGNATGTAPVLRQRPDPQPGRPGRAKSDPQDATASARAATWPTFLRQGRS